MQRIMVIAPAGKRCPRENCSGWIDDATAVPVAKTRFYGRLLKEGSLLVAPKSAAAAKPAKKETKREDK